MPIFALGAGAGALFLYFLDPQSGRRRRHVARDRTLALFRHGGRRATRAGRHLAADAYGAAQRARHLREEPKDYDDVTLAQKVKTEIFRDRDVPKGDIVVNAQNGVVQLRGEVPTPDLVEALVERTRRVQGVAEVENLLHLPNTEPQMHQ
jgi:hypothetical protein